VQGKSEEEVESRILQIDQWFNSLPIYQPLPGAVIAPAAGADVKSAKPAAAPAQGAAAAAAEPRELVYADTVRLVAPMLLKACIQLFATEPDSYDALAVVVRQDETDRFGLIACAEWESLFVAVWQVVPPAPGAGKVNWEQRLMAVLTAVESAPYRKEGPAAALAAVNQQRLSAAVAAQRELLQRAMSACDANMAATAELLSVAIKGFGVFSGADPFALLSNLDAL
jgi:hypothetical protein